MMPDLGKYAVEVLSAYAVTSVLVGGVILQSVLRARAARKRLAAAENANG